MPSFFPLNTFLRPLGLTHLPAVPVTESVTDLIETLGRLLIRDQQVAQAKAGLSAQYTIGTAAASASAFMFGPSDAADGNGQPDREGSIEQLKKELEGAGLDELKALLKRVLDRETRRASPVPTAVPLTALSLTAPEQFAMSWTTWDGVMRDARPLLPDMCRTLTDADAATAGFWPCIARHGVGYNLLVLQRVQPGQRDGLRGLFGATWDDTGMDPALDAGRLYAIDMRIWEAAGSDWSDSGAGRITPGVVVLLVQDAATKALAPACIRVASGGAVQTYARGTSTSGAWIYALQAAKTAVTAWGIWLGHVYHWHVVTAAMLMTMFQTLPEGHPIRELLEPQSKYLVEFDDVLLLLWDRIAPPTSVGSAWSYLRLTDTYAQGRLFSDDDPRVALARQHIDRSSFSRDADWDQFPLAGQLLAVWDAVEAYVTAVVAATYADDAAVAGDGALRAWRDASSDPDRGNVGGLPALVSRTELVSMLTSLVYRLTMHGVSRLNRSVNPQLSFVANFPPCLQDATLPAPGDEVPLERLLRYLPRTGTIGAMASFYYTFVFSPPYEPLIPEDGPGTGLFFPGGPDAPRNRALVGFRQAIMRFIESYAGEDAQYQQWPLGIET